MAVNYAIKQTANQYIQGGLEITASTSGANVTVTAKLYFRRTNVYSGIARSDPASLTIDIGGAKTNGSLNVEIAGGKQNEWQGPFLTATKTYTGQPAQNIPISWNFDDPFDNLDGSGSTSFAVPAGSVPPSGGYIDIISRTHDSVTAKIGVSSFGTPNTNKGLVFKVLDELYVAGKATRENDSLSNGATTTVTNQSVAYAGGITISGNKTYHTGIYAYNGAMEYRYQGPAFTTTCPPLSGLSLGSQSYAAYNTIKGVFNWSRQSDGGVLTRKLQYRYSTDNGASYSAWADVGGADATSGSFTISGLPTSKSIIVQARLATGVGYSGVKQMSFNSLTTHTKPNFPGFEYRDNNSAAVALTGSNQAFIQGQSKPIVTITAANKATDNQSVGISGYNITLGSDQYWLGYSSTDTVTKDLSAPPAPGSNGKLTLTVSAADNLSLSTSVSKEVVVYPWAPPTISASVERSGGFETNSMLKIKGTYSPLVVGGAVKNTIVVEFRRKKTSTTTWPDTWESRPVTINGSNWSTTDFLTQFDNTAAWDIQVRATDKFCPTIVPLLLPIGVPKFFIGDDGRVAVGKRPEVSLPSGKNGQLEVAGDIRADGTIYANGNLDIAGGCYSNAVDVGSTDLNSITQKTGFYRCCNSTNRPMSSDWWYIEQIVHNGNYIVQIARSFYDANLIYQRIKNNGTWAGWQRIATSAVILSQVYPVGSIYFTINKTTADAVKSALGGGTWVAWGTGRVPVGINTSDGNFNTIEKTGGATTHTHTTGGHTLTIAEIPAHSHGLRVGYQAGPQDNGTMRVDANSPKTTWGNSKDTGGGGSHSHGNTGSTSTLQPYITVYMWKRTA